MSEKNRARPASHPKETFWRANGIVIIALAVAVAGGEALLVLRPWRLITGARPMAVAGDPMADAKAALREELGAPGFKANVLYIPQRDVPHTDLAMRVGPYYIAVNGPASYLAWYDSPTRATSAAKRWRLARLSERQARGMIVTLRHIFDASGDPHYVTAEKPAAFSNLLMLRANINSPDEVLHGDGWQTREAIITRTAIRYLSNAAKDIEFLDNEAEIAALAREMFESSMKSQEAFRRDTLYWGLQYLTDFPDKDTLAVLEKVISRQEGRDVAERLRGLPVVWMLLPSSDQQTRLPNVNDALWTVTNLAGKTDEERAAILTEAVFGASAVTDPAAAEVAMNAFLRTQPAKFAEAAGKHWNSLAPGQRTHIIQVARPNHDVEPLAKLAAADANAYVRAEGIMILAWIYGGHEYAGAFLKTLPAFASLDGSQSPDTALLYYRACQVNVIHDETTEVARFFAREVLKTPAGSGAWRTLFLLNEDLPARSDEWGGTTTMLPAIAATLARVGGRENADALVHMAKCYGDTPFPTGSGKRYRSEWPPFVRPELSRELLASSDGALDDAMYAFVKETPPEKYGLPLCEMFIVALASKGDPRLVDLLAPLVEKIQKREAEAQARWQAEAEAARKGEKRPATAAVTMPSRQPFELDDNKCKKAYAAALVGSPTDPVQYLVDNYKPYDQTMDRCAMHILCERLTVAELETLLGDKRAEELRGPVYFALVKKRESERK